MERFRDQIDADEEGYRWLYTVLDRDDDVADRIESYNHDGNGRIVIAWLGNEPVAMFTVLRDMLNWSILIVETFEEE